MSPAAKKRKNRGFTLIEVLVAFSILALFLGAVMPTLSGSLAASRTGGDTVTATAYAQSLIAGVGIDGAVTAGVFTDTLERSRFTSRLEVRPFGGEAGEDGTPGLFQVIAEVGWRDGVRRRSVSLATYRYARSR